MTDSNSSQKKRVEAIFIDLEDLTVSDETMALYFDHLKEYLSLPFDVLVKGEDKKRIIDGVQESGDELYGLLGNVRDSSDDARAELIPLCDLRAVDNRSPNADLLMDYEFWFINYQ